MMKERFQKQWKALNLPAQATVTLALSGGSDSVVLLDLLQELGIPNLQAAHVNHGLRGEAAQRDQEFCQDLCRQRNIPLKVFQGDAAAYGKERGMSPEEGARALRYGFLDPLANGRDSFVVTAHHQGDQQETFWINLYRGSGSGGLRGMKLRRDGYLRPLLPFSQGEILAYAAARGLAFVEDETNQDSVYLRNFLRHQALPLLNSRPEGNLEKGLAAAMEILGEEDDALNQWAQSVTATDGATLGKLPPAVLKRVLDRMAGAPLSRFHFCMIRQILQTLPPSAQLQLPEGKLFRLEYGQCRFVAPIEGEEHLVVLDQPVDCGEQDFILRSKEIHNPFTHSLVDYGKIEGELVLRRKRAGDRFLPAGKKGTSQLQKRLKNDRVPRSERDALWVLAQRDGTVIWVEGYGVAEEFAPSKGAASAVYAEIKKRGKNKDDL